MNLTPEASLIVWQLFILFVIIANVVMTVIAFFQIKNSGLTHYQKSIQSVLIFLPIGAYCFLIFNNNRKSI
jgi:hypothetical protein